VLVLVLVIVIENRTMCQHKKSIGKRDRLFEATCVMFLVDYDYDYEHEAPDACDRDEGGEVMGRHA
jgi:hypothetical protein